MKSIIQKNKECYLCREIMDKEGDFASLPDKNLHSHHIIFGTANRQKSEKHGLKVWLCYEHHEGQQGVHHDKELDLKLKKIAQETYERRLTRQQFIDEFGKSYL